MAKLRIDLAILPKDTAETIRDTVRWAQAQRYKGLTLTTGATVFESDYAYEELSMFMKPGVYHLKKLLQDAFFSYASSQPGGAGFDPSNAALVLEKINDMFGAKEYKTVLDAELAKRRSECAKVTYPAVDPDTDDMFDASGATALDDALTTFGGIVIGGDHKENTHRDPIIDAMQSGAISAQNGTGLLFIEELNNNLQPFIDDYLDADEGAPMSGALNKYLTDAGAAFSVDFITMLNLAKSRGVRVVGIDTSEAKVEGVGKKSAAHHIERCAKMNANAAEIMQDAIAKSTKKGFVALVGEAHINTHEGGVPGLAQLFGVPGATVGASGRLKPAKEDKSLRKMPNAVIATLTDACLRDIETRFDGNPNETADWRDQYEAAEQIATEFATAKGLLPDFDLATAMKDSAMIAKLDAVTKAFKDRKTKREELVTLLKDDKVAEFRSKLATHLASDPDLMKNDLKTTDKSSVLVEAVLYGHSDVVDDLVKAGAEIADPEQSDAVFTALLACHDKTLADASIPAAQADMQLTAALKAVLDGGVDPNGLDRKDQTPLQKLIRKGITTQLGQLIDAGADPHARTARTKNADSDRSVIALAAENNPQAIAILAAKGASVDTIMNGETLLQKAIRENKPDIVSALLTSGAGVNRPLNKNGKTELHLAIATGNQTMINDLVAAGADPKVRDSDGTTALDALLYTEIARRVDEATNGPARALKTKRDEVSSKVTEIADLTKQLAEANTLADDLTTKLRTGDGFQSQNSADLLKTLTVTIPDLQAALNTANGDLVVLQAALPALELADPLHGLVTLIDANIDVLQSNLKTASGDEAKRIQAEIDAEKEHKKRAQAEQPMDPELIRAGVEELKSALGTRFDNAGTLNDIAQLVTGAPEVTTTIGSLQSALTDRKSDILAVVKAMNDKDYDTLNALFRQDPTLINTRIPDEENNRTLVQKAASQLNEEMLDYLLTKGPDLTLKTKAGGTVVHELFDRRVTPTTPPDGKNDDLRAAELASKKEQQTSMMLALLTADTSIIDAQDRMGMSALHLACLDGNPDAITALIDNGANESLRDQRGWKPIDVVTATTKPLAEQAYQEASNLTDDRKIIQPGETKLSTVEILMRATTCENPGDVARMRDMYENLYADPALRPVLDLAAVDAAHEHVVPDQSGGTTPTPTGLRIFVSERSQVGLLYNDTYDGNRKTPGLSSPRGAYEETSHVVMFGAGDDPQHFSPGTLIHELTHSCARMLYGTDDIPCDVPGGKSRTGKDGLMDPAISGSDYVAAIMQDARNSALLSDGNKDEYHIRETLFGRLDDKGYQSKGDKALLQEYLVSVPQLIAEYGIGPVRKAAPGLVDYFTGSFADACVAKAASNTYSDTAGSIDNTALIAKVGNVPSVKPIADTISAGHKDASLNGVVDRIGKLFTASKGEMPTPDATNGLPTNISLPTKSESFELPDRMKADFERKMKDIRKAMRAAYDKGDLPEDISSELLREMTTNVTALMADNSGKALRNAVQETTSNFIRDSKRTDLEKRAQEIGGLDNRQIAELVLIRAEDAVWVAANPTAPPPPHPDYDRKKHKALVDDVAAKLDDLFADTPDKRRSAGRLTHDPVALNAFINDQKLAIAQANKAMKEKNNVVKLDKKRVKSAWFAKLKQIAS